MPEKFQYRDISTIKKNPRNPRTIKDSQFKKLVKSIKDNTDYFEARPIILSDRTGELIVIAGNMRYEAAKKVGLKRVPTFLLRDLTEEREKEIMIRDNVGNGEWDMDMIANEWDRDELIDWGFEFLNMIDFMGESEPVAPPISENGYTSFKFGEIECNIDNETYTRFKNKCPSEGLEEYLGKMFDIHSKLNLVL